MPGGVTDAALTVDRRLPLPADPVYHGRSGEDRFRQDEEADGDEYAQQPSHDEPDRVTPPVIIQPVLRFHANRVPAVFLIGRPKHLRWFIGG